MPPEMLAKFGEALEQQQQDSVVEVWPEHWAAFELLRRTVTQWHAVAGATGMLWTGADYGALRPAYERIKRLLPRKARLSWRRVFETFQQFERARISRQVDRLTSAG